ncbi:Transcriptional regulator CRZ1 [Cladobotryum mycophilum]|uniref:Transcriptional regulator CRZ1 n=1 Tax=Cladobotryum mycophilum TaxID=491253 RepID=A0ABR0SUN7_9HYPO
MVSLEQPFHLFTQQQQEEYARYPSPPHNAVFTTAPMDMGLTADAFGHFGHRAGSQEIYSTPNTTMGYEPSLFADATPNYVLNTRASPGMYGDEHDMRLSSSSLSTASAPSAPSSAIGSPQSHHGQINSLPEWNTHGLGVQPSIVNNDYMEYAAFAGHGMEELTAFDFAGAVHTKSFVDPSLIHPEVSRPPMAMPPYDAYQAAHSYPPTSPSAVSSSPQPHMIRTNSSSPYLHSGSFHPAYVTSPYAASIGPDARRLSMGNFISPASTDYPSESDIKEKQRCTYPDCGKIFKDLKAHMLTHQNERPEKCPIQTCEYHIKGFARKYDKNRHTLTHYKGTMVCGFCPGSGSAAEKSFNRADVFKRHLTAVHGVEQTPPNSRKKSGAGVNSGKKLTGYAPDATGKCSTCSQTFSNAQDFYEHLDDCVLRIVQQEDPAEAINAQRLAEVENDKSVHMTLEKNNLPTTTQAAQTEEDEDDYDMLDEEEVDDGSKINSTSPTASKKKMNPPNGVQKSRGITHSRGGVPIATKTRGRKNRRDYPSSWGFDKGQMTMKKRIMAVFDGPRRLAKDDMMLSTDHEVRIKLADGKSYVTDLDVQTLKRAEGFLGATDEEKGPWISDDPTEEQLKEMQEMLKNTSGI